jgi:alanyl-tRNA synthetase
MPYDAALEAGAIALFGEKYGDDVRVLSMGSTEEASAARAYSVELCGGTHVRRLGDIALFKIVGESAVSAGVRRIEALTGERARLWLEAQARHAQDAAGALKTSTHELAARVEALLDDKKRLERELSEARKAAALGAGERPSESSEDINGVRFVGRILNGVAAKDLRGLIDDSKRALGSGVAAFIGVNEGKLALAVGVTPDLTTRVSAVDLARAGAEAAGGAGGGGRPDLAQAGGPDGARAEDALSAIRRAVSAAH